MHKEISLDYSVFEEYIESPEFDIKSLIPEEQKQFLMENTGFDTSKQTAMYLRIKEEKPHLSNHEVNHIFATRTQQDFLGYYWEFLARQPVLINYLNLENSEIVSSKTGQRLLEVINDDERSGAVKRAIEVLEDDLNEADPNTLFAIHSPSGWAKDGFDDLPDDQIYLYYLDENKNLSAITLRLTMNLEDHEEIIGNLIKDENYNKGLNIKTRLIKTSATIVQMQDTSFLDYLEIIEKQVNSENAWEDKYTNGELIKNHSFEDIKNALKSLDDLNLTDEDIQAIADNLDKFLRRNVDFSKPENLRQLIIQMGKSALDMQHALEVKKGFKGGKNYQKLYQKAKELGGCVATSKGRLSEAQLRAKGYKESGFCIVCRQTAKWIGPCGICYGCELKM